MKRVTINHRQVKVGDVIGNKYSSSDVEKLEKANIWMPEKDTMAYSSGTPKTFTEFERELKALNPRLYMEWRGGTPTVEAPYGHIIRFRDITKPEGYDWITGIGSAGDKIIHANSQFTHYFNPDRKTYETRMTSKGWSQCLNEVYAFLISKGLAYNA